MCLRVDQDVDPPVLVVEVLLVVARLEKKDAVALARDDDVHRVESVVLADDEPAGVDREVLVDVAGSAPVGLVVVDADDGGGCPHVVDEEFVRRAVAPRDRQQNQERDERADDLHTSTSMCIVAAQPIITKEFQLRSLMR